MFCLDRAEGLLAMLPADFLKQNPPLRSKCTVVGIIWESGQKNTSSRDDINITFLRHVR